MDDISLSPDVRNFLQNQIAAGIYTSLSDAVNANINILIVQTSMVQKRKKEIEDDIKKGLADVSAGRVHDGLEFINGLIGNYE